MTEQKKAGGAERPVEADVGPFRLTESPAEQSAVQRAFEAAYAAELGDSFGVDPASGRYVGIFVQRLFDAFVAGVSAACARLDEEADFGCPDRQDEALTRENADLLREWAGLQPNEQAQPTRTAKR